MPDYFYRSISCNSKDPMTLVLLFCRAEKIVYEVKNSTKWRINKFQVYQRNVILCNPQFSSAPTSTSIPPNSLAKQVCKMKFSCKVDKSSNRSTGAAFSSTYEQFLFSVLLGDLPLFLSIFSSFYGAVSRERIEGCHSAHDYELL